MRQIGGGDEEWSLGPVDVRRSVKDEKGGAAETEPWPGAACTHHHHRHVSRANNLNTVSDILLQVQRTV